MPVWRRLGLRSKTLIQPLNSSGFYYSNRASDNLKVEAASDPGGESEPLPVPVADTQAVTLSSSS